MWRNDWELEKFQGKMKRMSIDKFWKILQSLLQNHQNICVSLIEKVNSQNKWQGGQKKSNFK